jgi:PAS domain S-box-containing protein
MRLATAVEQAGEAILITDRDAHIVYVNPAFEQVSGFSRAELVGHNPRLLQSGRHGPEFYAAMWSALRAGETWRGTLFNLRKDGVLYEVDAVISPLRDSRGEVDSYVGVERDISRERALERELVEAGRMEAVGQLAGGIAHDFNNLLTAIAGYAELLRNEVPADSESQADVDEILRASRSAAGLVRQLLAFGRRQVLEPAGLGLDVLVEQLRPMLAGLLGPRVKFEAASSGPVAPVFADPGQIEQVLVNLAVNARDAMPDGGVLTIATGETDLDSEYTRAHSMAVPGRYATLTVSDTGTGMSDDTLSHVFEPFFTTKGPGKGTGLGLATVYGIVRQSGGSVTATSELGRGSAFTVFLPLVEPRPPEPAETRAVAEPLPARSGTILVVEDDDPVRGFAIRVLQRAGYRVIAASGGAAALAAAREQTIDLLLTDVVMPTMSGREVANRLAAVVPGLRVLFVSGHDESTIVRQGVLEPNLRYLAKPFTAEALVGAVDAVMEGRTSRQ